jgi:hypothetical protein
MIVQSLALPRDTFHGFSFAHSCRLLRANVAFPHVTAVKEYPAQIDFELRFIRTYSPRSDPDHAVFSTLKCHIHAQK